MGGPGGGEVASSLAARRISGAVLASYMQDMTDRNVFEMLVTACEDAGQEIYLEGQKDITCTGMGTTAVMALLRDKKACVVSVGDSRAYLCTGLEVNGRLIQITHDHSIVQELLDDGAITIKEAEHHPKRNIITRALGTPRMAEPDCFSVDLLEGDVLLLCTDGLTNSVEEHELRSKLLERQSLEEAVDRMLDASLRAGAQDNVTILLISL